VQGFGFLNYDDFYIFFGNAKVRGGLAMESLAWALTTTYYEYWHPVMWWSHMLDWQLFGSWAGGHHLMSLGLHVANSLLVYAVLRRMTGMMWRSAAVGALFALHPLHVESVAWLAERKDVLSGFFALGCFWAYARYVERTRISGARWAGFYGLALTFFALGLLTKPMVVTVPFVLLLLDYWPLVRNADPPSLRYGAASCGPAVASLWRGKLQSAESRNTGLPWLVLVREKVPFFVLTLVFCVVTWWSVKAGDHVQSTEAVPWLARMANIPIAYVGYIWKAVWPVGLAVLYPMSNHWEWWPVSISVVLLMLATWMVLIGRRQAPYALFGWMMFLGMLVPTIGLVPVGPQAMADRYMYLPSIGLFVAVVWGVAELSKILEGRSHVLAGASATALIVCGYLTWVQTGFWRDSVSLWSHCLEVAPESRLAHYNLGACYLEMGRMDDAIREYRATLRLDPEYADANLNLGVALTLQGRPTEATNCFAAVLRQKPDEPKALVNLGVALAALGEFDGALANSRRALEIDARVNGAHNCIGRVLSAQGKSDEAIDSFRKAIGLNTNDFDAYYQLGVELLKQGKAADAIPALQRAKEIEPNNSAARVQLASALEQTRATREAIVEYREALRLKPDWPDVMNNLAWILATVADEKLRNGTEAVELAVRASSGSQEAPTMFIGTLAAAYAEAGQFEKAVETAQKACDLASARGEPELLKRNQELLELFRKRQPYREAK
jgi:tetratricopeptide (TPR) repeat protein